MNEQSPFYPHISEVYFWMWKDIRGLVLCFQDHGVRIHTGPESRIVKKFTTWIPAISFFGSTVRIFIKKYQGFQIICLHYVTAIS